MTLLEFLKVIKKEENLKSVPAAIDFWIKKSGGKWHKEWTAETIRKVAYKRQKPSFILAADIVWLSLLLCEDKKIPNIMAIKIEELRPDLLPALKKIGGEK